MITLDRPYIMYKDVKVSVYMQRRQQIYVI